MKKKLLFIPIFLVLILALFLAIFYYSSLQAPSTDSTKKAFVINQGDGLQIIAARLEKYKFIKNQYVFIIYSRISGLNQKIKAGTFYLASADNLPDLTTKLTKGGSTDYWLKIIDGTRVEELSNSFPDNLTFTGQDFVTKAKKLQGYIFPDSYLIPKYYTVDQILAIIQANFDEKFAQAKIGATNTKMTDKEILTLASIIEREARTLKVKEGVAGVLINRLDIKMPLQSDVTIQYVRDSKTNPSDFWKDISSSDISIVSPYNTYKNSGLPPGPICNPGYDSIYAAFHPTTSDYLFYLTGNDGVMYYAKTLSEHNINIDKYLR